MKITDVKTYHMRGVRRNWTFVKMETDQGLYGWGEGTLEGLEHTVEQAIHALANRCLIGQDPTNIERHWQVMYRHGFWRGGPVLGSAVAALDQALWDVTGKAYGVPVYKLLGGPVRDRVRVYTHANSPGEIKHSIEESGFTAFKCTAWYRSENVEERQIVPRFKEQIAAYRDLVGPDIDIMYDNHGLSRPSQAIAMMRAVEEYNLYFFEEPTQPDNLDNLARVRHAANVKTPIATGERLYHRWDYRYLLENQLADIIQPDISHCFGISELNRIAAAAETYYIRIAPHNPNGPICTAAAVQVCAAIPNFAILETIDSPPWHKKVQKEPLKFVNGYIELPTTPGLGVDLDEEVIKSRPYVAPPKRALHNYYSDGSPVEGVIGRRAPREDVK
ncbi:unnamed protein product [marine sediment metagenome]|uniref:Mandelate racemase/muconate lactonizing enzyme C-terminal domain-containing protein n=1 Tax=marine sediment metagenome TaxID=412755 RepID=X0SCZ1_9ZZZZ